MAEFHDVECNAHSNDPLSIFREAIGITEIVPVKCSEKRSKAQNIGLYKRVVTGERTARIQYHISALLINAFFLLQLAFAAILTALGAAGASHVAVTVFGALNTVLAAILSFAKGRGLPSRFRQQQFALRRVREHIEQIERDFSRPGCALDSHEEVKIIIEMHNAARANSENNDP